KTKAFKSFLGALPESRSTLVVLAEHVEQVERSASNLDNTKTVLAPVLSIRDILKYERLLVTEEALAVIEGLWALPAEKRTPSQWQLARQAARETAAGESA